MIRLWMTRQTTMEDDLKWNARRELDRREADQEEKHDGRA